MYVWGGYGKPGFRPFFEYAHRVESETDMKIANLITWQKRRAYGVQHNYLSTREEFLYMVKGDIKRPAVFNVPYLDTKRGYTGYNAKYPAKSEFYRRNNVWTDITEILRQGPSSPKAHQGFRDSHPRKHEPRRLVVRPIRRIIHDGMGRTKAVTQLDLRRER